MNYIHNPPNNLLPVFLLDILEKQTDEKNRLSQAQILGILKEEYDMVVDRKTLRRNMEQLIDLGFGIKYDETENKSPVRKKNKETGEMETMKDPVTGEEVILTISEKHLVL